MFKQVLQFWFEEISPSQRFSKDSKLDQQIEQRFGELHQRATQCELHLWRNQPQGRLAEIIILDQFSRNLYRNSKLAFAYDNLALGLAQEAISNGAHLALPAEQKSFLYMPFMHSESAKIHLIAEQLFKQEGLENNYKFELRHKAIIDQFGRYPHRNRILGRQSTPEEEAFLKQPGSSF